MRESCHKIVVQISILLQGGKPKFPQITGGEIFHESPKPNKF